MARKKRVDGLASQAHIVTGTWNLCLRMFTGYNPVGYWEVSQEGLAEYLHLGRATAQRALEQLVTYGCITIEEGKLENGAYLDDNEPDEKRGKAPKRYHVTQQQLLLMAIRLHKHDAGMLMIHDPSGWVHLVYRQTVQELIDVGTIVLNEKIPAYGRSEVNFMMSYEVEVFSELRNQYVPMDTALDEILGTQFDNK